MRLRLIAGNLGGRFIEAPKTSRIHPMGERIRGSLFNQLGDLSSKRVLDAFAGSGALGLEAISRGAEHVTFVERDKLAQQVIAKNIDQLDVQDQAKLSRSSVSAWVDSQPAKRQKLKDDPRRSSATTATRTALVRQDESSANRDVSYAADSGLYDLILADPPYANLQLSTISKMVMYLKPHGLMILSYPGRESTPTVNGVVVVDNRSYGDAALAFYRPE